MRRKSLELDDAKKLEFITLWSSKTPVLKIGAALQLRYAQVYYIAKKLGLSTRKMEHTETQKRHISSNWGKGRHRIKAEPDPVIIAYGKGGLAPLRHVEPNTRQMIDDAMRAGKLQVLPFMHPDDSERIKAELDIILKS